MPETAAEHLTRLALELPVDRRAAFVTAVCAGDSTLRAGIESLLAAQNEPTGWSAALAHYTIIEKAGADDSGVVYKARDERHNRVVALKLLKAQPHLQDARAASSLEHPNIGVVHDVGETDAGEAYIVTPWIESETLQDRLRRGPLPVAEAVSVAARLAEALQAAHDAGIVHRNVNPGNVMVGVNTTVRLLGFGVAGTAGTAAGMSPEQTRGEPVDPRSDIWSLGVLLYEMLAGVPPFPGADDEAVNHAIRHDDAPDIGGLRADVPAALAVVIERCLRRSPDERWLHAADLQAALDNIAVPIDPAPAVDAAEQVEAMRRLAMRRLTVRRTTVRAVVVQRFLSGRRSRVAGAAVALATFGIASWAVFGPDTVDITAGSALPAMIEMERARIRPTRIVVAAFENRTGDRGLDVVGNIAADWITQSLVQTELVDVVPVTAALAASRHVESEQPAGADRARLMAEETRAGIVIHGVYHRQGNSLHLRATVADGISGSVLEDVEPVAVSIDDPLAGVEVLRRRVLNVLAARLDSRMRYYAAEPEAPPSLDAYAAYTEGLQVFLGRDWHGAIARFADAAALDSTFGLPIYYAGIAHSNLGNFAAVDSVIAVLRPHADRYGAALRLGIDVLDAWARGDYTASYQLQLRAAELAPNTLGHSTLILDALRVNRPRKAVAVARELDPARGELRGWFTYWTHLAAAHHRLGEHDHELAAARRARVLFPAERDVLILEVEALAALGRTVELNRLLERELKDDAHPAGLLRAAALELRAHGFREPADSLIQRSLASELAAPGNGPAFLYSLARTHVMLGQLDDAERLLHTLAAQLPDDITVRGMLGTVAARRGNGVAARRASDWLAEIDEPYIRGRHTFWRARIAAALGENAEAVELTRRAWREGAYVWTAVHSEPDFDGLQADLRFREFVRPRG